MTLKQMRAACLASMAYGDIEVGEGAGILAAIDRQIAAGRDPNTHLPGPIIDLDRLPGPSEVMFDQLGLLSRALAAGQQGIGAPDRQG